MAAPPTGVRIRSYNVGFGDCFLLTFGYASGKPRNVLIDFGSTKQSATGPSGGMKEIAAKIGEDCGGKLEMLVATHRHADHISGFGGDTGKAIAELKPEVVVQPWTEEPGLDPEASGPAGGGKGALKARAAAARLSAMQAMAAAALEQVPRLQRAPGVSKTVAEQVSFLGETNLANLDAVRNLASMGKKHVYAHFGTKLALGQILPGVRVDVLGPPTLEQSSAISQQAATDEEEFWHLAGRHLAAVEGGDGELFPGAPKARRMPQEARWVIPRIDRMRGEELLAILRSLDGVLNNTSVILLFEVGDSRLVFPGDAQLENWHYALRECDEAEAIRERLASACFYKVGHHGSLNATPKSLWNGFERRDAKPERGRLATMVSTAAGKHGSTARGTEVPRKLLIDELAKMSDLSNTQSLKSRSVFWNDVEIEF
jgi:ribonuclease BN (tRNA processing enzyme)